MQFSYLFRLSSSLDPALISFLVYICFYVAGQDFRHLTAAWCVLLGHTQLGQVVIAFNFLLYCIPRFGSLFCFKSLFEFELFLNSWNLKSNQQENTSNVQSYMLHIILCYIHLNSAPKILKLCAALLYYTIIQLKGFAALPRVTTFWTSRVLIAVFF